MANSKTYQYTVVYQPAGKDKKAETVVDLTTVLAPNEQVAHTMAVRAIPPTWDDRLEELEVIVRPF